MVKILFSKLEFRRPDDGNENDFTVIMVTLDRVIKPGEEVTIEMDFEAVLTKGIRKNWVL